MLVDHLRKIEKAVNDVLVGASEIPAGIVSDDNPNVWHSQVTPDRPATARGFIWQAQLDLRRRQAEMRRAIPHNGTPQECRLCKALDVLRDAEREIDAARIKSGRR